MRPYLELEGMVSMKWTDERLMWDPEEYNTTKIHVTPASVWRPDIVFMNRYVSSQMSYSGICYKWTENCTREV